MLCVRPQVWPLPTKKLNYSKNSVKFFKQQIKFTPKAEEPALFMLNRAFSIFYENLEKLTQPTLEWAETSDIDIFNITISIYRSEVTTLKLETNESYVLNIMLVEGVLIADIAANTFFGARHGLETLSQLIWWNDERPYGMLEVLHEVTVEDAPKFPYRGLMVDTARNYIPMELIKRAVDGMAASKLNVLHLHLTDAESFPLSIPGLEQFVEYGAYSSEMTYSVQDIIELIEYAKVRGIRVILEIDAPSHVNSGWEWGENEDLGQLVMCNEKPFGGQLNPDNPIVLDVLEKLYGALLELSQDSQLFHIGGDEVELNCWRSAESSSGFTDMKQFWANYTSRMLERLIRANNGSSPEHIIIWSSPLTYSRYLNSIPGHENITVQFWFGNPINFLQAGYKVIYSTVGRWYLDCGFNRWRPSMQNGVCDPYTPWQTFYEYRPWMEYGYQNQALGGEACLWTEQVEVDSFETRLWPRVAAFAERMWSDPPRMDNYDVYTRLGSHRARLLSRGLKAEAMWPRWCTQHPGEC